MIMNRQQAYQSFVYHGERIYGPLGEKSTYHEEMRARWAFIYDNKLYKYLPNDPTEADAILKYLPSGYFERRDVEGLKSILKDIQKGLKRIPPDTPVIFAPNPFNEGLVILVKKIIGGE
jgi:hypothetical protein